MFTGLIEDVGTVRDIRISADQAVLSVKTAIPMSELKLGESIAINGVCLTVTQFGDGLFCADVSPETLNCTTLGKLSNGSRVNLERALRLTDRLGGHMVTGHVDGLAKVVERRQEGNAWRFSFQADESLCALLVAKGSVAIDGISLTVNEVAAESFSLAIIPHTLNMTTLDEFKVGDNVNVETDLIGKYVAKFIANNGTGKPQGVTMETLAKHGFL
ncbi:MAG: riboflavin synthase [Gammaproteobacteria bacterium]|nr:riboflavin synthase [Gammaproteobacteria bacterium]NIR25843.1 riboflavin synthase [Gammaproteobacteria bacterium]NIX17800.1 riboflavin synthase [Gammaproteobacteria bacterium]NIY18958.1 riboflavin synthase [Gammaproteobacteria bacterium]